MNAFNPEQLVARGVFDSLEELDRVMLELDEARKEPRIIACAWREGMSFETQINTKGEWLKYKGTSGPATQRRPIYASNVGAEGLTARIAGGSPASLSNLPAACAVGAGEPLYRFSGKPAEASVGVVNTSRRSPELLPADASVLCPWCAIERAMQGHGAAPRAGFVSVARCARHSAESPVPTVAASHPHNRSAA